MCENLKIKIKIRLAIRSEAITLNQSIMILRARTRCFRVYEIEI